MNIFVLCTGRCGSTTFARATAHANNFSIGHESRATEVGSRRFDYPPNHIEIDNRLSWFLGRLDDKFGDSAAYVHLRRNPVDVATSYNQRWTARVSIMAAYRGGVLKGAAQAPSLDICTDYVVTVERNISLFLRGKTRVLEIWLENWIETYPKFWSWAGLVGDFDLALNELKVTHNATDASTSVSDSELS